MMLELRDGAPVKKTTFHKVTNPDNPAQHIYLREDIYTGLIDELDNGAMNFSFKALWEGAKNVVNKVIQVVKQAVPGGGGGASPGGGGGFPILTNAQGQPTIVVTAPVPPPAALPPQYMQTTAKDNTMMYVLGAAAIGAVLLLKK